MRISNVKIGSATLTGRSGINLDEHGSKRTDTILTCWVLDGVSPLIFRRTHAWQFKKFFRAGKILNKEFFDAEWMNIEHAFRKISENIKASKHRSDFLSGFFFHWPLFSCGLVQINKKTDKIKMVLYGDCMIIEDRDCGIRKYEYKELESRKTRRNRVFGILDLILNTKTSTCLKRIIFAIVRIGQIWFGDSRVFSINKYFDPAVVELSSAEGVKGIYILSDGASWYVKDNDDNTKELVNSLNYRGVKETIDWIRSQEDKNRDFGRYDDATIVAITV